MNIIRNHFFFGLHIIFATIVVAFRCNNHAHLRRDASHNLQRGSPLKESADDVAPDLDPDDWRAFRARLVLGANNDESSSSNTESLGRSTAWAYDSGDVIEPGSIILAKVEPEFCYFGLHQQYFHKSVMLVTHHKENIFTRGIILNRPSNLFLSDDDFLDEDGEPFVKGGDKHQDDSWRIWFGGDVNGLYSDDPEIICLHSISTKIAQQHSEEIIKNVMMTNYEGARKIIDAGEAESSDFWVFAGYAGWNAGQLLDELKRESWYMVSADSETVWSELVRQRDEDNADPRDAGLQTWTMLMGMIGKEHEAQQLGESFADLTLKEWAADSILFNSTMVNAVIQDDTDDSEAINTQLDEAGLIDSVDKLVRLALDAKDGKAVGAGSILRGSPADRSPFLLSDQKFHKTTLLLLQDTASLSVGVMLNHPTTQDYPMLLPNGKEVKIAVRYGGSFGIPLITDQPVIFLHAKPELKDNHFGEPVGYSIVWICSDRQVIEAISKGHAVPNDFMAIQGFSIWAKDAGEVEDGILGEILGDRFEVVDPKHSEEIWSTLLSQEQLALDTIDNNCQLSHRAWGKGGQKDELFSHCVYGSTVSVSELADDALRYWIEAFLLGEVISAGKYSAFE